ncbi:MAG TPA: hypothetical protein VGV89_07275 [Thermoplasmata archaeon]|nr:hypothetical protein [Thermoplasmata archaeon]
MSRSEPPPAAQDSDPGDHLARVGAWAGVLRAAYITADVALRTNDVGMIRRALAGIRDTIPEVMPEAVDQRPRTGAAAEAAAALFRRANLGGRRG